MIRKTLHFALECAPYIAMVLLGHTVTSLDHHSQDWSWSIYLLSCTSTLILGIAIYCVVESLHVQPMLGYALAVLAGRNTKETLDLFSQDLMSWLKKGSLK